jgi:hypothetical protein
MLLHVRSDPSGGATQTEGAPSSKVDEAVQVLAARMWLALGPEIRDACASMARDLADGVDGLRGFANALSSAISASQKTLGHLQSPLRA